MGSPVCTNCLARAFIEKRQTLLFRVTSGVLSEWDRGRRRGHFNRHVSGQIPGEIEIGFSAPVLGLIKQHLNALVKDDLASAAH